MSQAIAMAKGGYEVVELMEDGLESKVGFIPAGELTQFGSKRDLSFMVDKDPNNENHPPYKKQWDLGIYFGKIKRRANKMAEESADRCGADYYELIRNVPGRFYRRTGLLGPNIGVGYCHATTQLYVRVKTDD